MKSAFFYFCFCALALLTSCSKSSGPFDIEVEYIPFQEEEGGLWGMIGTDGEVLFSEEFKEEPTIALNGRFIVKNNDGLLEYYTAEKKPRKIGDEYIEAAPFFDKVAPVVRKDKAVELIDLEGNVVCTLDEVAGKRIVQVSNFSEGIAVIKTSDGYGCINTSGEVVVKPHYASINQCSEGKIVAVDSKYKDVEPSEGKITILDKKGNVTAEFGISNLYEAGTCFKEGLLPVIVETNSGKEAGFVDENGEWIIKPSSKTHQVSNVYEKHFIYYDGDSYGVKNIDGETVIRAKYRELRFTSDKVLVFKNEKGEQGLIDINGNKLVDDTFEAIYGLFQNKYFIAKTGHNNWELMDIEGNSMSRKIDMYGIG
ncbi:MAG: WG repeat-containing protein, partial [Bacteroidaceae bacterium]|nr:WG repeat-containing protein [Bacteroidaceae bacterium]